MVNLILLPTGKRHERNIGALQSSFFTVLRLPQAIIDLYEANAKK